MKEVRMVKAKEIVALCEDSGWVSAVKISEAFDIPLDKACLALKLCWDKGLLMPVDRAWFAPPTEDGLPLQFAGVKGQLNRERWYLPYLNMLRELWANDPMLALTVNDTAELLDISQNTARKVLYHLADLGEVRQYEAKKGGAFGHKPRIFGLDEQAIKERERQLQLQKISRNVERKRDKEQLQAVEGEYVAPKVDMPRDY